MKIHENRGSAVENQVTSSVSPHASNNDRKITIDFFNKLWSFERAEALLTTINSSGVTRVPIFDDIISPKSVWPIEAHWPLYRAELLVERFRGRFPNIYYDIYWETRLMNAQAYIGANGRSVRLYGGLGRHRQVGVEGIAFALAHEVGHHLGGPPHHQFYTTISSEVRASEWAQEIGLPAVFGDAVARRYVRRGVAQLAAVWKKYREEYGGFEEIQRAGM